MQRRQEPNLPSGAFVFILDQERAFEVFGLRYWAPRVSRRIDHREFPLRCIGAHFGKRSAQFCPGPRDGALARSLRPIREMGLGKAG